MNLFRRILSSYLLIWLTGTCVVAFYWTQIPGVQTFVDPFRVPSYVMQGMIAITMLAIGSLLPMEEILMVVRRWPKILGGTCVQYLSMPLLAFLASNLFGLEGAYFYGLMLVGCVPGAMASNMLTMIARGNVSYSVGLTTSATLLSPLVVPATLVFFISRHVQLDVAEMSWTLLLTVVLPVAIGFTLSQIWKGWNRAAQAVGEIVANLVIIWIIASVVAANRSSFQEFPLFLIAPLLFVNLGGYLAGFLGGKLIRIDSRMSRALIVEVGMQNAGLGTFLARKYFPDDPHVALCCAMYTFGCMFTGIVLVQFMRYFSASDSDDAVR